MNIDFNSPLLTIAGKPILLDEGKEPTTLKIVAVEALMRIYQDEPNLSGGEKFKRFKLAQRIHKCEKPEHFSIEQVAKLKDLIGKSFSPLIVGPAFEIIDGTPGETGVGEDA